MIVAWAILYGVTVKLPILRKATKAKLLGFFLLVCSLVVTAVLAEMSGSKKPPSSLEAWLLAVMAAALQIAAGASFTSVGRADPAHARSSVRHLLALGLRAKEARRLTERTLENESTRAQQQVVIGQLSVYLSEIEEGATLAAESWADFHGDAVGDMFHNAPDQIERENNA